MTNFSGNFLPQLFTITPPVLLTSSANTSVNLRQRSARVEKGPVSEIVVPSKIGSLQEFSLAKAGPDISNANPAVARIRVTQYFIFVSVCG